jgi:hypothetical protein
MEAHLVIPLPMCAICNKRVLRLDLSEDHERREMVATVRCHGATETTRLTFAMVRDLRGAAHLEGGVAFATAALAAP